jgi:mannose-6-phosphate isomerase
MAVESRTLYPLKLPPSFREKIWGSRDLAPIFDAHAKLIGEAWYTFEENVITNGGHRGRTLGEVMELLGPRLMGRSYRPSGLQRRSAREAASAGPAGPYFPILAKLLFTSDKLSVQVHPDDAYALQHDGGPGKTEMWYVVRAEPGASVALGLTRKMTRDEMRAAALDGTIARFLDWRPVEAGQTLFIPPGTLHSIGAGLWFCEIQQNSDLTYRFFDFERLGDDGKPRALHIEEAVAVTKQDAHPGPAAPLPLPAANGKRELLSACRYFAAERLEWDGTFDYQPDPEHLDLLIFLRGRGLLGAETYSPGDAYLIPAEAPVFKVEAETPTEVIRAYVPELEKVREELRGAGATEDQILRLVTS